MKGIILAGGSGTRLHPITQCISKQLLPIYDKPMIYYPLSVLMMAEIKEILIISTPRDTPHIKNLLGDGSHLGLSLHYKVQECPRGLSEAFILGEDFIDGDDVALILGDNLFYGDIHFLNKAVADQKESKDPYKARIFGYFVKDPTRYGVVEFDKASNHVLSIEEKPKAPKSNYAIPGLYIFDGSVSKRAHKLTTSDRGELEITDLMKSYLREEQLKVELIGRKVSWLDTGTTDSLLDASLFIGQLQKRQGLKIACIEEIALRKKFITIDQYNAILESMPKGPYKVYLDKCKKELI